MTFDGGYLPGGAGPATTGDAGPAEATTSPVVTPWADRPIEDAEDRQDDPDADEDQPDRPEDARVEHEAQDQEDDAEHDHCASVSSNASLMPAGRVSHARPAA